ncbi:hypothetical protein PIB30_020532 [Stylosanthes scabra]|uniref:Retrotransposon gag domain-containing protein n=1 Tax=Stylosanthes scabra TaxID=79078 RepID=A0ABU6Y8V3_9FABA|nr:hypothetical protein [Stylosanthes scabra]
MVDTQLNDYVTDDNIPQPTPEKGIIPSGQNVQQLEAALRELLERQTRDAEVAAEAMKRTEAMAAKRRLSSKLCWKRLRSPSTVAGNPPARENNKHHFSLAFLSEELPKKFKYPTDMEPYDGSGDPKHHLDAFDNRMVLLNASDATKCKAFSVIFKKDALTWFNSLAPGSIKNFSDLSGGFLKNFTTRRRLPKTCLNLY